jgi:LmbE family N-acetylglucosaminyl deacetylase
MLPGVDFFHPFVVYLNSFCLNRDMKRPFFIFLFLVAYLCGRSQSYPTSGEIYLGLKKLNVLGSVLYIAAHPDDENTRLMTYFSKDRLYRTGYLSLTRGDGGQNLIGEEQGVELGLIRTQELLSARRIDGAEQFFSRAYDFGYSKTPAETFTKWDREKILSDVVWVIRKFRPDVIITRFPTTGEGGHGHHTASAILANEAFTAAADPSRFPEQLAFVQPWQAKRIFFNSFNFGNAPPPADGLKLDVGGYNPVLGKSYGEIAALSRSQHKSQGFGATLTRGEAIESFKLTGGSEAASDVFDDVDVSWNKVKGGEKIIPVVNQIISTFDFMQPQKSVPQLLQLYQLLNAMPRSYWTEQKMKEVLGLVESAGGLWIEAYTTEQYAVQGDSIRVNFVLNDRLGTGVKVNRVKVDRYDTVLSATLEKNRNLLFVKTLAVPEDKEITQPYWLQNKMAEGYFNVAKQELIGQADVQNAYDVSFDLEIAGVKITLSRPLRYKFTDQVRGEIYWPVVVVPMATFNEISSFYLKNSNENDQINLNITANRNINVPSPAAVSQVFDNRADTVPYLVGPFTLAKRQVYNDIISLKTLQPKTYRINLTPLYRSPGYILRSINYNHIPAITYFKPAITTIRDFDVKTYNKKIGYIIGAGDKVPEALEQMGYDVTLLTEKELSRNNLQQYDAIITGVRTFNTNEWMARYYDKLMKYVENGGNYIVQYSQANNVRAKMGPYPFVLSGKRITDETATVTFLNPDHPVMNFPNKITQADFQGWIQERSIYHADKYDSHYETIFRMNDPGEQPDDGSLLIAKYGKGYFTYTGLVFFRELPAGVSGAYRLLANIIALNRKKEF